jgi:hypothetical protein
VRAGELDWSAAILNTASRRAKKKSLTIPSPVDRGKTRLKIHFLSDVDGIPLAVSISGADAHGRTMLHPWKSRFLR